MSFNRRTSFVLMAGALAAAAALGPSTRAQEKKYPKQADLPNPYRRKSRPALFQAIRIGEVTGVS